MNVLDKVLFYAILLTIALVCTIGLGLITAYTYLKLGLL